MYNKKFALNYKFNGLQKIVKERGQSTSSTEQQLNVAKAKLAKFSEDYDFCKCFIQYIQHNSQDYTLMWSQCQLARKHSNAQGVEIDYLTA